MVDLIVFCVQSAPCRRMLDTSGEMKRGLPSIALFVLVICEDNSELTIGDSGGVGDRSAHVSREYRVEYDISIVHLFL